MISICWPKFQELGFSTNVPAESVRMNLEGYEVNILATNGLIRAKTTVGRIKDQLALPELEALREAALDEEE